MMPDTHCPGQQGSTGASDQEGRRQQQAPCPRNTHLRLLVLLARLRRNDHQLLRVRHRRRLRVRQPPRLGQLKLGAQQLGPRGVQLGAHRRQLGGGRRAALLRLSPQVSQLNGHRHQLVLQLQ